MVPQLELSEVVLFIFNRFNNAYQQLESLTYINTK